MGNRLLVDPTLGASPNPVDGDGFIDTPNPGKFIGNDSGALTVGPATGDPNGGFDLIDATPIGGPPGSLCFDVGAAWALPFIDGCADQNRTYSVLGNAVQASDNYLDPYFSAATGGPGTFSDYALVDSAMGVLLTESTNRYFALSFFSSTSRNGDPNDIFDHGFDMGALVNGDPNPMDSRNNVVPWQPIPEPVVIPFGLSETGLEVSLSWNPVRLVHDGSSRPMVTVNVDAGRSVLGQGPDGTPIMGVGVLDEPVLVRYQVERRDFDAGTTCDPNLPWTAVGSPAFQPPTGTQSFQIVVTVPPQGCVRLKTSFGRVPAATFRTVPNIANRNANRLAQAGMLGDLGYEVVSPGIPVQGMCDEVPSGLVAWWPAEGDAGDLMGTNPGVLVNGATTGSGIVGAAFQFDGVNDYVDIPHSPSLFFDNQQAFTLEGWFKPESEAPSYFILKNGAYGLRWEGTQSRLRFYNGTDHFSNRQTWELGHWYHVALVDDGATSLKLYVDGVLDSSEDGPARNPNRFPCHPAGYCFALQFGGVYETHDIEYFHGQVDEVSLYDRALTATEVNAIFRAASAGKCRDEDGDQFSLPYDCDDTDPAVNPLAVEGCNGIDDDCDTAVDEGLGSTMCGVGACQRTVQNCVDGQAQTCESGAPSTEICDSIDNDCTGTADDGDLDGDSFLVCADCNDTSASIHPGAQEVCNGLDDDCDAQVDEDAQGLDSDGDSVRNTCDNCRFQFNPSQADTDGDHIGNSCDNCLLMMNPLQEDLDGDLRGNVCDNCPSEYNTLQDDTDGDRVGDVCDNCALQSNTAQTDLDSDLQGDVCDENDGLIYVLLSDPTSLTYQLEAGFDTFNVYRGSLVVLASLGIYTQSTLDSPYAAQFCERVSGGLDDAFSPAPGQIVHYLVTGVGVIEGSLGANSAGQERPHDNPCP